MKKEGNEIENGNSNKNVFDKEDINENENIRYHESITVKGKQENLSHTYIYFYHCLFLLPK